ncbi:SMC-Scp complex subunit ScpB [Modestobacter roseus]|uniref:Segregation and condensation protein B n=1 Tax=Modestobacter roseus TaxID=1181884 RepID=A0A562IPM0_9ACTN|nr:SMC-Scp complex subunit ScpB [Modestobacter roseus]MQA35090.1 SMC-Scp complex subunit ScpB [Modestobacter roseus]TWH72663.1 segregation and condensation protein B [Modestobacter roseus]
MSGPGHPGDDDGTAPEERPEFSWDALAAEFAAAAQDDEPPVESWDAIAAQLAAGLGTPVEDGAPPEGPAPVDGPVRPLERGPAAPPVELEVVPEPEMPVEEPTATPEPALDALPLDALPLDALPLDAPPLDAVALRGGLEALLFVADAPLDEGTLAAAMRCSVLRLRAELADLGADYDARRAGVVLRRVGEGWRLYTREEHAPVVERHLLGGQRSRLTQAALETLAVIAYRQPVTRARVSAIRGVGVDAVVRTLVTRGLIREAGSDPDTGGGLYVTTPLFLERLGLTGLDELPPLAPLVPDTRSMLDEHPER